MTIDAIITDLDDTLLNEEGEISRYTMDVLQECLRRGIRVIPCSGRAQASMEIFVRQLNTRYPYIACNGAQLVNADHTLMEELVLPMELARRICAFWKAADSYMQVYRGDTFYYERECQSSRDYKRSSQMRGEAVGDLQAFLTFDTPKVLCVDDPERIAALYPPSVEAFGGQVALTISKPYFMEATPLCGTKGAALGRLAKRMGLDPARTAVFGDSLNDLSMLAFTPNSVAMGNAREEVKKAARYACPPNSQDGVARFVEKHILSATP